MLDKYLMSLFRLRNYTPGGATENWKWFAPLILQISFIVADTQGKNILGKYRVARKNCNKHEEYFFQRKWNHIQWINLY